MKEVAKEFVATDDKNTDCKQCRIIWKKTDISEEKLDKKKLKVNIELIEEHIQDNNKPINLIIEGDNYKSLQHLNKDYCGKVDVIYIDPPYNRGKDTDWYRDNFTIGKDKYSKWLSFMEKRLILAENLISKRGVIFISIDDNSFAHLKLLCDQVFKELEFTCNFIWESGSAGQNDKEKNIRICNEYILCYSNKDFKFNLREKELKRYVDKLPYDNLAYEGDNIKEGLFQPISIKKHQDYTVRIKLKNGKCLEGIPSYIPQNTVESYQEEGRIVVNNQKTVYVKSFLDEEKQGMVHNNLILKTMGFGTCQKGTNELNATIGVDREIKKFYPKPVGLIKYLIEISSSTDSIICDFFAGSGTTGEAVLRLNNLDSGNRTFILCTNNEVGKENKKNLKKRGVEEGSEAYESMGIFRYVLYPRIRNFINDIQLFNNSRGGNFKYYRINED